MVYFLLMQALLSQSFQFKNELLKAIKRQYDLSSAFPHNSRLPCGNCFCHEACGKLLDTKYSVNASLSDSKYEVKSMGASRDRTVPQAFVAQLLSIREWNTAIYDPKQFLRFQPIEPNFYFQ